MVITVYDNNDGEVLACIDVDKQDYFSRKGIDVFIQEDAEPVFIQDKEGIMHLHPNAFLIKL